MVRQAVEQGECESCGASDNNFMVENQGVGKAGVGLELSCECGADAVVAITEDGLDAKENISHESATWNSSDDEQNT